MKNFKASAIVLAYKREKNLDKVIEGLKKQTFINKIYIFHNAPSKKKIKGVINIFSEENFGCYARHVFSLMLKDDYFFYVDDDTYLTRDLTEEFSKAVNLSPSSIIGIFGANFNFNCSNIDYKNSQMIRFSNFYRYVDMAIGRVHLANRLSLLNSIDFITKNRSKIPGLEKDTFIHDDLILNITNQMAGNPPALLIPAKPDDIKNLDSSFGSSLNMSHYNIRTILLNHFFENGYSSNLEKSEFVNKNLKNGEIFLKYENLVKKINQSISEKDINSAKKILKDIREIYIPNLTLYNLASLYLLSGKKDKGKKIFLSLLERNLEHEHNDIRALVYFKLSLIELENNNKNKAFNLLNKCLLRMPEHKKAKQILKSLKD